MVASANTHMEQEGAVEILLLIIAALLAAVVWKLSKIEKRLAVMHLDWAKVMSPRIDPVSREAVGFTGDSTPEAADAPRSVLDQIGLQMEISAQAQRAHWRPQSAPEY